MVEGQILDLANMGALYVKNDGTDGTRIISQCFNSLAKSLTTLGAKHPESLEIDTTDGRDVVPF